MTHVLSNLSALSPGHQLWILPEASLSRWTQRVNWYLNFQVSKLEQKVPANTPAPLQNLLDEVEWQIPQQRVVDSAPLMVFSPRRVPARWVVVVPEAGDLDAWTTKIHALWMQLQRPSLRVFMPAGLPSGTAPQSLKGFPTDADIALVLEPAV